MDATERRRQLIARAIKGEAAAFEQLFLAERRRLLALIRALLPDSLCSIIEPDDVLQDVFQQAFTHHDTFEDRGDDAVYQWLAAIARNHVRNLIRAQGAAKRGGGWSRRELAHLDGEASVVSVLDQLVHHRRSPSASAAAHEMMLLVESALSHLPGDHRTVLELRYLKGKSVAQTAAAMERTEAATKMLCSRALVSLRNALRVSVDGV